jgi:RND superfamily putative drug exporter
MLTRLGRFAARHHWWFIGTWLVLAVTLGTLSNRAGGIPVDDFDIPGTESQRAVDLLESQFPAAAGTSATAVFQAPDGKVTDPQNQQAIEASFAEFAKLPDAGTVISPFATGSPDAGNISSDGTVVYVGVQFSVPAGDLPKSIVDDLRSAAEPATQAGLNVQFGGPVVDVFEPAPPGISQYADDIGLALAVVILLLALGSVTSMLVPIATALFGVGVSMAIVTLLERVADIGSVAPILGAMLGLGVGIDYSLFIVNRHRQNLAAGQEPREAAASAVATSGSAVLFAGMTVCLAMVALGLMGVPYVRTLGLVAAMFVAVSVIAALTLVPAVLGLFGRKVTSLSMPWHHVGSDAAVTDASSSLSARWARQIARRPWFWAPLSLLVLLLLAAPMLRIETGFPDDGTAPTDTTQRQAFDLLDQAFGPGANGPLVIVGPLPADAARDPGPSLEAIEGFVQKLEATPGVERVIPGANPPAYSVAFIEVIPTTSPDDPATTRLVEELRSTGIAEALQGTDIDASQVHVGGTTASLIDLTDRIDSRLWLIIATVLAGSFLLLMMVFRSVFVPLKAAIMNLLSIGAAYGVIVAVFQWGWAKGLIGLDETISVAPFVPVMMFAILFGLSMDYEVFLLSRIREEYLRSGDSHESVVIGLANTARVITAAASIMIAVFLSYVTNPVPTVKMIGLGLAVAVFVDATVVRMILVPATMELLGKANWWLPRWLDRILPHINVEGPAPATGAGEAG